MKKRIITIILLLTFVFTLASCKLVNNTSSNTNNTTNVVTTTTEVPTSSTTTPTTSTEVPTSSTTTPTTSTEVPTTSTTTPTTTTEVPTSSTTTPTTSTEVPTSSTTTPTTSTEVPTTSTTTPTTSTTTEIDVTNISLNKTILTLTEGNTETLIATITPADATNKTITWSSSNEDVATVTNGRVTAIKEGNAIITATSNDSNIYAICELTVAKATISVTDVYINYDELNLNVGDSVTLSAIIIPSNATNQAINWSSSNEDVLTVNNGTITAISAGNAKITVTTVDGNFTYECNITVIQEENTDYNVDENDSDILTITAAGEYTLERDYKQIYVNAPDAEVIINLNGHTIQNDENSPIYVEDCDTIEISATKSTTSYIIDSRTSYDENDETQGKGAIYVLNGDLKLKGKGTLNITTSYYNGIHAKDDVTIKNLTLNITAINHAIRGNDSITIESGIVTISCGGDGLHTENSDVSSKGVQRGNVTISGGTVTINSWGDGIAAAYNAIIEEADSTIPTSIEIKTNKYSSYSGEVITTSTSSLYLKLNSSTYSNGNYTYAAYINGTWYKATYVGYVSNNMGGFGGRGGSYYYIYKLDKPASATSFTLYRFSGSNVTNFSTTSYNAVSDAKAFNSAYDMVQISVSSNKINFSSWSNYSSSNSTSISAKGIKAENEIYVTGGTVSITAYDDGIHANNDGALENGSTPLGNVNISGGNITISSADDGIHADYTLNISGGYINITNSYEGLEGNLIKISGGETYVYSTDDGVNATSGKSSPNITVSGGLLDVTVPTSGDTDGIDSNGTYTQTGGVVIVKGPGSASGRTMGAAALDTDGSVRITSGTLIVFGGIEQTPSSSVTKTLCSSSTVSAGNHTITIGSTSYTTTLKTSCSGCIVYSSLGSATLK